MEDKLKIISYLEDKLYNHNLDMDGFGHGYETGLKEAILIIKKYL